MFYDVVLPKVSSLYDDRKSLHVLTSKEFPKHKNTPTIKHTDI